jgi:hypothetical protein
MEERMSMTQTMLGEKLQKRGFIPREVEFSAAIARFLNNGGTLQRAYDLLSVAADRMGAGGHASPAVKAKKEMPPASLPNGDEGHRSGADKAIADVPSSPPSPSGSGHPGNAPSHPRPAAPAREPSKADISAMIAARKESAVAVLTIFDRYKVRDGRALKKLRFHELMKLAQEDEGEARAFRYMVAEVESKVANPDRMARVTDLVSAELAEKAFAFAKVASNA